MIEVHTFDPEPYAARKLSPNNIVYMLADTNILKVADDFANQTGNLLEEIQKGKTQELQTIPHLGEFEIAALQKSAADAHADTRLLKSAQLLLSLASKNDIFINPENITFHPDALEIEGSAFALQRYPNAESLVENETVWS